MEIQVIQDKIYETRGGRRHMPFAFTGIGVAMLSSETATSIRRMSARYSKA
jgi:hypothetical protein